MVITGAANNQVNFYQGEKVKTDVGQEIFSLEEHKEVSEVEQKQPGQVPDKFAGMSLMDLLNSNETKKNQIPVVNQVVSSKNPQDGKIYLTYFTDNKITCNNAEGKRAWEVDINSAEQAQKVKDFSKIIHRTNGLKNYIQVKIWEWLQ